MKKKLINKWKNSWVKRFTLFYNLGTEVFLYYRPEIANIGYWLKHSVFFCHSIICNDQSFSQTSFSLLPHKSCQQHNRLAGILWWDISVHQFWQDQNFLFQVCPSGSTELRNMYYFTSNGQAYMYMLLVIFDSMSQLTH